MNSPQKGAWARRDFVVKDGTTTEGCKVKLWGSQTDLIDESFINQPTEVKNVRLDRWGGVNALGSTDETIVRVCTYFVPTKLTAVKVVVLNGNMKQERKFNIINRGSKLILVLLQKFHSFFIPLH